MTRTIRKDGDRTAVQLSFPGTGRVKQSFLDECDVNFIMNKWKRTGELPPAHTIPPSYGDFSNVATYMQAKNATLEADKQFNALPSWVRERFQNDPAELLDFMDNPDNLAEAQHLGLVTRPPSEKGVGPEPEPEPDPEPGPEPPTPPSP